ncbi:hypothetical protein [Pseudomonas sp. 18173]|uniref:hypothetical protein n=1 Tax=Pseudomonas sp. 18173 TaxID=3390055 RepID=UPI003D21B5D5
MNNSGGQLSAVNKIERLTWLEVRFEAPGMSSKEIYANGRMQVKVLVVVQAIDINGDVVPLDYFPDLLNARLIEYDEGKPLRSDVYHGIPLSGWAVSIGENPYQHELATGSMPYRLARSAPKQKIEFWVSSSVIGTMQIAAEIMVQGKVYRSNNVVGANGSIFDSSVTVRAVPSPRYTAELFSQHDEKVVEHGALARRYFGLILGGRRVRLIKWMPRGSAIVVNYPLDIFRENQTENQWLFADMVPTHHRTVTLGAGWGNITIAVNERDGELMMLYGDSWGHLPPEQLKRGVFFFDVVDEYGCVHPLSLQMVGDKNDIVLRNG